MCALLAGPPWFKSKPEILSLDPWWIVNVLLYPRNDKGELIPLVEPGKPPPAANAMTFHWEFWRRRGVSEEKIAELWLKSEAERKAYNTRRKTKPR